MTREEPTNKKQAIFKYEIKNRDNTIKLPRGCHIVHTALVQERPFIWVLFPDKDDTNRVEADFVLFDTGQSIHENMIYVGTYHFANGTVQHLFYSIILQPKFTSNDL